MRDPLGVRPLVSGRLEAAWLLASESCALDSLGARFVRAVEPGESVSGPKFAPSMYSTWPPAVSALREPSPYTRETTGGR